MSKLPTYPMLSNVVHKQDIDMWICKISKLFPVALRVTSNTKEVHNNREFPLLSWLFLMWHLSSSCQHYIWINQCLKQHVSAFQNGMTLAFRTKIGLTIDRNMWSIFLGQILDKTLRGYIGYLKSIFGVTKGKKWCPLMDRSCVEIKIIFWGPHLTNNKFYPIVPDNIWVTTVIEKRCSWIKPGPKLLKLR